MKIEGLYDSEIPLSDPKPKAQYVLLQRHLNNLCLLPLL